MTTIAQGERATNTLRAGQQLQVTVSSGSALVERFIGSTLIDKDAVSASVRYGPYTEDLQYRVTCISGLISLELDSALRAFPDGSPVSADGILPRADTQFPAERVSMSAAGGVCGAPCQIERIRCVTGTSVALTVYEGAASTATTLLTATLSAGEEASIATPIRAINGVRAVFASGSFDFYISQEV